MGVYQNGTEVRITETFGIETVPGDFTTFVPTDPTSVTFYLRDPDGTITIYVFGVDAEVTNPDVGVFVLEPGSLSLAGAWYYRVEGSGAVVAVCEGEFTILPSSVLVPVVSEPVDGPCQSWCDAQDILNCSPDLIPNSDTSILESAAYEASQMLFQLSGRIYSGSCGPVTRNPIAIGCAGCGAWMFPGLSPGAPQFPVGAFGWWGPGYGGFGWGSGCGCSLPLSRALLGGYPVTAITEVKIDGVVLDPDEYRLDEWRYLTRTADIDGNPQSWPACPRFDLPVDDVGTWTVTYRHGKTPPALGVRAAAQLGAQVYKACTGVGDCMLPPGTTQVTRAGVTVVKAPFIAWGRMNGRWATGLTAVDMFLAAFNPAGLQRRPVSWSPGTYKYARKLGVGA